MKRSRFTEQQIAFALQQAEGGTPVAEVCRKMGISEQTFYRWKKRFGGLMPSEVRRLKQMEEENSRLRRLVADLSLDKEMLQEVIRKNFRACSAAGVGGVFTGLFSGQHKAGLRSDAGGAIHHVLHIS